MRRQPPLPYFEDFEGMAQVIGGFIEQTMPQSGTQDGPQTDIQGQIVQVLRTAIFGEPKSLQDLIAKHKTGHEEQTVPSNRQNAGPNFRIWVPMNHEGHVHEFQKYKSNFKDYQSLRTNSSKLQVVLFGCCTFAKSNPNPRPNPRP